ncbi:hypothetical protein [Afipia carboxidovorans]|uniref:hypothetical protein n=1 Tax=Afipia carboxidovorans TaxID=40137 RepID=UPI0030867577|nr:hypothetical protein CRBSH125_05820 [Afipia carboxidovorans]
MTNPWFKYYPTDWRADPRLRMCSLASRGLWIELLGYMHEAEPYGHLNINGSNPTEAEIASLVGRPLAEVRRALSELASRQVFSIDSNTGAMYSRRMVRDKAKALKDKENGGRGGNPKLKATDNGGVNPKDKAQIPEARSQKPEKKETRASALIDDGWPEDFRERFWSRYPNKVGKPRALAKLEHCRKRFVQFDAIMTGLDRYIAGKPPDRAWLNPETFLNQERWTDQPAAPASGGRGPPGNSFASVHLDLLQNAHGEHHDSPGFGEFDAPGFDIDLKADSGR